MSVASPAALSALVGRREAALLELDSVARMANLLAERCAPSWVRLAVSTLDRFRADVVGEPQRLTELLDAARIELGVAISALGSFAAAHNHESASQVEALAFGAKVWFALNDVPVPWRPLRPGDSAPSGPHGDLGSGDLRLLLQALIGSGLSVEEFTTLRLNQVGSLLPDGRVEVDVLAAPLALAYPDPADPSRHLLTFLPFHASDALMQSLARRAAAGERLDGDALLMSDEPVDAAGTTAVEAARHHHERLINAGNDVNVSTCRATGDFFRAWGMPGARFEDRNQTNETAPLLHAPLLHAPPSHAPTEDPA